MAKRPKSGCAQTSPSPRPIRNVVSFVAEAVRGFGDADPRGGSMMSGRRNMSIPEIRDRGVRLVDEDRWNDPWKWLAMTSIAGKVGCPTETLRCYCREEPSRRARPAAQAAEDRDRLEKLEREQPKFCRANGILRNVFTYFGDDGACCRRRRRRGLHRRQPGGRHPVATGAA